MGVGDRRVWEESIGDRLTFLEDLCAIHLDQPEIGIFVLLAVAHLGRLGREGNVVQNNVVVLAELLHNHHVDTLGSGMAAGQIESRDVFVNTTMYAMCLYGCDFKGEN